MNQTIESSVMWRERKKRTEMKERERKGKERKRKKPLTLGKNYVEYRYVFRSTTLDIDLKLLFL